MTRTLISSGSRFEAEIGYSRAVAQGDWIFVSGTTGFDYSTMTIADEGVGQLMALLKQLQIDENTVRIRIEDNQKSELVEITKQEWEVLKYTSKEKNNEIETEVVGSFIQYPIKLAWAITIHKSQGKTFDNVLINLKGGAFEHGQTYVALSRCRTFAGIRLVRPVTYRDILVDERIVDFYQQIR